MTGNVPIDSVSIYHDLNNIDLYFEVAEIPVATGFVWEGRTTLRSGTRQVSTSGLKFIELPFEALTLENSKSYLIGFKFEGRANQNFFYNNQNVRFSVDHFTDIDGVDNTTANFVMPAVAVNVVPEPATLGLLAAGGAIGLLGRRRRSAGPARRAASGGVPPPSGVLFRPVARAYARVFPRPALRGA
jgi:hypothetical protein